MICLSKLKLSPIDYEATGQLLQLWKKYPKCELLLRWSQKPPPAWLQCEIGLIGARDHSYFLLDLDPGIWIYPMLQDCSMI